MDFRILGPVEVTAGGRTITIASRRQRALLALLLIHANEALSSDRIADELWGDEAPASGAKAVAFHVGRLRGALVGDRRGEGRSAGDVDRDPLRTVPGGYLLRAEPDAIDAIRAERLGHAAERLLAPDPAAAREELEQALALWRGEPMSDLDDARFAQPEIARLHELQLRLIELRGEADLALGRHAEIVGELRDLVTANPYRERLRGQLMLALYRSGRQGEALHVAQDGRRMLSEELGIDPSPELLDLERSILRQDGALGAPGSRGTSRNPFKGLRPFDEQDAADFFGREGLVDRLLRRLADVARGDGLLVLVGPSGSGKSSIVRAGLVPAIRRGAVPGSQEWAIATMEPGSHPFEELAAALARAGLGGIGAAELRRAGLAPAVEPLSLDRRLVLVIDQLEELFWRVRDDALRDDFLRVLGGVLAMRPGRIVVVATLRADALDRALSASDIAEPIRTGVEVVGRLTAEELARAITRPVASVGVELDPGLLPRIVADVVDRPGSLPLLQYALTELYDRSDGRRLTSEGYEALGGVMGAVGRRAEDVHGDLDTDGRRVARQVFLRLADLHEGAAPTARRMRRDDLRSLDVPSGTLETVLAAFGRARLLSFDRDPATGEPTVEPAHEALLSHWARLAGWIDEASQGLWMRRRLGEAAAEWDRADRDPAYLLAGSRLALFSDWAASTTLGLSRIEMAYVAESEAEALRMAGAEAARRAEEHRLERRARRWLGASVGLLAGVSLLAVGFATFVLLQSETSREQQAIAISRELAAAAVGSLATDPELSLLLAVQAASATSARGFVTEEAMDALQWAHQASATAYPRTDLPTAVRSAPDGPRGMYLIPPAELVRVAIEAAPRTLSAEECRTYLHQPACPVPVIAGARELLVYAGGRLVAPELLATAGLAGTHVRLAVELPEGIELSLGSFEARTGATVEVVPLRASGGPLLDGVLAADLVISPRSGWLEALAVDEGMVDASAIAGVEAIRARIGGRVVDPWITDAEPWNPDTPRLIGVPLFASVEGLLWYRRAAFDEAGYRVPGSWQELEDLAARMRADGRTPWCLGLEDGASSGSSGSDWIEDLVLLHGGPAAHTALGDGRLAFSASSVASAVRRFGDVVFTPGSVLGGLSSAERTPVSWAGLPLLVESRRCWLFNGSSSSLAGWPRAPADLAVVPLPEPAGASNRLIRGRVYGLAIRHDRPEVRALIELLLGEPYGHDAMQLLGEHGLFPLAGLDPRVIRAGPARSAAELLAGAVADGRLYPDASDRMPVAVGSGAFPRGVLRYLEWNSESSDTLTAILAEIDQAWPGRTP